MREVFKPRDLKGSSSWFRRSIDKETRDLTYWCRALKSGAQMGAAHIFKPLHGRACLKPWAARHAAAVSTASFCSTSEITDQKHQQTRQCDNRNWQSNCKNIRSTGNWSAIRCGPNDFHFDIPIDQCREAIASAPRPVKSRSHKTTCSPIQNASTSGTGCRHACRLGNRRKYNYWVSARLGPVQSLIPASVE